MDISDLRDRIDAIDRELADLFIRRMAVSAAIGAYKKEQGLPVHVPHREQEIIQKLSRNSPEDLAPYVARLYEEIFLLSREYQHTLSEG